MGTYFSIDTRGATHPIDSVMKLVQFYFPIHAHNGDIERPFCLKPKQWIEERSKLCFKAVKETQTMQYSSKCVSCEQFRTYTEWRRSHLTRCLTCWL